MASESDESRLPPIPIEPRWPTCCPSTRNPHLSTRDEFEPMLAVPALDQDRRARQVLRSEQRRISAVGAGAAFWDQAGNPKPGGQPAPAHLRVHSTSTVGML